MPGASRAGLGPAHSAQPEALFSSKRWLLQPPGAAGGRAFRLAIREAKEHSDCIVASSEDVPDRNAAEALRGARVFVPRSSFPTAGDDEYYWVDLIGLAVVNREGVALGSVRELLASGPQTTLVLDATEDGKPVERMVPFVAVFVDKVDLAGRLITVDCSRRWAAIRARRHALRRHHPFSELFARLVSGVTLPRIKQVEVVPESPRLCRRQLPRVNDRPFGGGGMVMWRAFITCLDAVLAARGAPVPVLLISPIGERSTCNRAMVTSAGAVLICGRYGGIDQRFIDARHAPINLGDFIVWRRDPRHGLARCGRAPATGCAGRRSQPRQDSFNPRWTACSTAPTTPGRNGGARWYRAADVRATTQIERWRATSRHPRIGRLIEAARAASPPVAERPSKKA